MGITYYDTLSCSDKMIFDNDITDGSIGRCTTIKEKKEETWNYSVEKDVLQIDKLSTYAIVGNCLLNLKGECEGYIPDVTKTRELSSTTGTYPDYIISNLRW